MRDLSPRGRIQVGWSFGIFSLNRIAGNAVAIERRNRAKTVLAN
jgi:hypothetical protein